MKRTIPNEIREQVLARDNKTCQEQGCTASLRNGDAVNIHHVRPEQFGGTEAPSNLITLCDIHHKRMHTEFHAFYPDSEKILQKMTSVTASTQSRVKKRFGVDDAYDLTLYLEHLTGHRTFNEGQLATIRAALSGKDVLFVTPTGSGKSICYQLPGLIKDDPTLVISPLKTLMKDQVESIWNLKIPTTYINSDLTLSEKNARFKFIKQGLYKFIFVAPERFHKSKDANTDKLYQKYAYLVIDEAHAIDSWGKSFRPAYKELGSLRERLGNPPIIALTASASETTQKTIIKSLNMKSPQVIVTGFFRSNIEIRKHTFTSHKSYGNTFTKDRYITNIIENNQNDKILIFVPTVKVGEELIDHLPVTKGQIDFFHSKLSSRIKMKLQDRFSGKAKPSLDILISTSAFGMGINIPNIRHVIHWSPALSIEDYYQQIGRAGRDGIQSYAHLLYENSDEKKLEYITTRMLSSENFKKKHNYSSKDVRDLWLSLEYKLQQMLDIVHIAPGKEWAYILNYFGEEQVELNSPSIGRQPSTPKEIDQHNQPEKPIVQEEPTVERITFGQNKRKKRDLFISWFAVLKPWLIILSIFTFVMLIIYTFLF